MRSLDSRYFFDSERWLTLADRQRESYCRADPFPHVVLDDVLPEEVAREILTVFPSPDFSGFRQPDNKYQKNKQGKLQESYFLGVSPVIRHILNEFNGMAFLDFLQRLTGIEGLIADPHFRGGALHQITSGGRLAVHADFNVDDRRKLDRRINVLYYLNNDWKDEYGGQLELWDRKMSRCVVRISPTFNRMVIFNTDSTSFHGHPDELKCPEAITRKSIALYYYTSGRPDKDLRHQHGTLWQERPGENIRHTTQNRRVMIQIKSIAKDLMPPILTRTIRKMMSRPRTID